MQYRYAQPKKRSRIGGRMLLLIVLAALALSVLIVRGTLNSMKSDVSDKWGGSVSDEDDTAGEDSRPSNEDIMKVEAETVLSMMSTQDKVGQLLLIRSNGLGAADFAQLAADCKAGGAVLFGDDIKEKDADSLKALIAKLQEAGGGHSLICVDEEGGTVVRVSSNPRLRSVAYSSPQQIYTLYGMDGIRDDAADKCEFLKGFGINVNFAPVADVVTSPDGFMYKRAFGKGSEETAAYVSAVVGVMEQHNMGCCIKHFPSYGNSSGDTHQGTVIVDTVSTVIEERDLPPFAAGIKAGADSVMVTHSIVTALDPDRPASMSPAVISVLRDKLGFDGVIVSDAMDMGAIKAYSGSDDVCVTAFLAGIDLLCTPSDPKAAYNALLAAVDSGRISPERLDESVLRIIRWKLKLGLYPMEG